MERRKPAGGRRTDDGWIRGWTVAVEETGGTQGPSDHIPPGGRQHSLVKDLAHRPPPHCILHPSLKKFFWGFKDNRPHLTLPQSHRVPGLQPPLRTLFWGMSNTENHKAEVGWYDGLSFWVGVKAKAILSPCDSAPGACRDTLTRVSRREVGRSARLPPSGGVLRPPWPPPARQLRPPGLRPRKPCCMPPRSELGRSSPHPRPPGRASRWFTLSDGY